MGCHTFIAGHSADCRRQQLPATTARNRQEHAVASTTFKAYDEGDLRKPPLDRYSYRLRPLLGRRKLWPIQVQPTM